jgi:hypothetical protein
MNDGDGLATLGGREQASMLSDKKIHSIGAKFN